MEDISGQFFEISAVSRLTGISSHVLRVWERRYQVVEPDRSDSGRRRYSQSDIQRLVLLKTLVDNGHSIGTVAGLPTEQLEQRLEGILGPAGDVAPSIPGAKREVLCRVAAVGSIIRQAVRDAALEAPQLRIVGEFNTVEELRSSLRPQAAELLIVECETLFLEQIQELVSIKQDLEARRLIIIYQFANQDAFRGEVPEGVTMLRAPVDSSEIHLACIADIELSRRAIQARHKQQLEDEFSVSKNAPRRLFTDEQLVEISRISSVVECECPQHTSSIVSNLAAFERYSALCESRNEDDAELHAFLHQRTAESRFEMEKTLFVLLRQEGIVLKDGLPELTDDEKIEA